MLHHPLETLSPAFLPQHGAMDGAGQGSARLSRKAYVPAGAQGDGAVGVAIVTRCRIVQTLVEEMSELAAERVALRRSRRRLRCHVRQIGMYLCHVILQMSLTEIGIAYGRDRTTAGHACRVVEDLRDEPAYDAFVTRLERVIQAIFPQAPLALSPVEPAHA